MTTPTNTPDPGLPPLSLDLESVFASPWAEICAWNEASPGPEASRAADALTAAIKRLASDYGRACYAQARADLIAELRPVAWAFERPGAPFQAWTTNPSADNLKREKLIPLAIIPKE